jgi:hypothetical protein
MVGMGRGRWTLCPLPPRIVFLQFEADVFQKCGRTSLGSVFLQEGVEETRGEKCRPLIPCQLLAAQVKFFLKKAHISNRPHDPIVTHYDSTILIHHSFHISRCHCLADKGIVLGQGLGDNGSS